MYCDAAASTLGFSPAQNRARILAASFLITLLPVVRGVGRAILCIAVEKPASALSDSIPGDSYIMGSLGFYCNLTDSVSKQVFVYVSTSIGIVYVVVACVYLMVTLRSIERTCQSGYSRAVALRPALIMGPSYGAANEIDSEYMVVRNPRLWEILFAPFVYPAYIQWTIVRDVILGLASSFLSPIIFSCVVGPLFMLFVMSRYIWGPLSWMVRNSGLQVLSAGVGLATVGVGGADGGATGGPSDPSSTAVGPTVDEDDYGAGGVMGVHRAAARGTRTKFVSSLLGQVGRRHLSSSRASVSVGGGLGGDDDDRPRVPHAHNRASLLVATDDIQDELYGYGLSAQQQPLLADQAVPEGRPVGSPQESDHATSTDRWQRLVFGWFYTSYDMVVAQAVCVSLFLISVLVATPVLNFAIPMTLIAILSTVPIVTVVILLFVVRSCDRTDKLQSRRGHAEATLLGGIRAGRNLTSQVTFV